MIVTGGRGFIGTNVLNQIDGTSYDLRDGLDIRRLEQTKDMLNKDVVHLAAVPGIPSSIKDPIYSHGVNDIGTINVLDAARRNDCKVIIASSAAADNCISPYAAYKKAGELFAYAYNKTYGLRYTALRFANVYGPHSMHKESAVSQMCKDAITKGEIYINGYFERDFIHVDDIVRAIFCSLTADYDGVLNIGTGKLTPVHHIAEIVSHETAADIIYKPQRAGDVKAVKMDISKAEETIGWTPNIELERGLLQTIEWFKAELHGY